MTIEELAAVPGQSVGSKEAAAILGCDRYALNIAAKQGTLNLPYFFSGNRLKISNRHRAVSKRNHGCLHKHAFPVRLIFFFVLTACSRRRANHRRNTIYRRGKLHLCAI